MKRSATVLALASLGLLAACQDNATGPTFAAVDVGQSFLKDASSLRARGATNNRGDFRAHFNAHSGLKGESAKGHWFYRTGPKGKEIRQVADVVCLSVTDNQAVLGLRFTNKTTDKAHPAGSYALVVVQDNGKAKKLKSPDTWAFAEGVKLPKPDPKKGGKEDELRCDQPIKIKLAPWPGNISVLERKGQPDEDDGELMVTPSELTLDVGERRILTAAFTNDDDDDEHTFTWTSSNESVATVNSIGAVTSIAPGTATITVTSNGQSASTAITVTAPPTPVTVIVVVISSVDNSPVANATVTLAYAGGSSLGQVTNGSGEVVWSNQLAGTAATITATATDGRTKTSSSSGFVAGDNTIMIALAPLPELTYQEVIAAAYQSCIANDGGDTDVDVQCGIYRDQGLAAPRDVTLTITIVDFFGNPLAGRSVQVRFVDGEGFNVGPLDATGSFTRANLPAGLRMQISIFDTNGHSSVMDLTGGLISGAYAFRLAAPGLDTDGDGVPDEQDGCPLDPNCQ